MIRDLVLYFLRQGAYSGAGDIAVLCAYLGQLQKVRAALKDLRIAVAVDERDEDQLARQGIADETEFEEVVVARHVRFNLADIFSLAHLSVDSTGDCRYLPRTRGQDSHCLLGSELWNF